MNIRILSVGGPLLCAIALMANCTSAPSSAETSEAADAPPTPAAIAGSPPSTLAPQEETAESLLLTDDAAIAILKAMQQAGDSTQQPRLHSHLSRTAARIRDGITTKRYLISTLGLSYLKETSTDGQPTATWALRHRVERPATQSAPATTLVCQQSLTVTFNDQNVVASHVFRESIQEEDVQLPPPTPGNEP